MITRVRVSYIPLKHSAIGFQPSGGEEVVEKSRGRRKQDSVVKPLIGVDPCESVSKDLFFQRRRPLLDSRLRGNEGNEKLSAVRREKTRRQPGAVSPPQSLISRELVGFGKPTLHALRHNLSSPALYKDPPWCLGGKSSFPGKKRTGRPSCPERPV